MTSGMCGKNLTWTLDDKGTLTISGTGAMEDFFWSDGKLNSTWWTYRKEIEKIII